MPNQRKKGKKVVGAWIDESLYNLIRQEAVSQNIPISELMIRILKEQVQKHARKHEKKSHQS
jgi:hypothetical protein